MNFLDYLERTGQQLYIAGALFSPLERLGMLCLAEAFEARLQEAGLDPKQHLFLPFRDSDQALLSGDDKARSLYELDLIALDSAAALITRLDGLVKDSGSVMELGYAYAKGKNVAVLTTDILWEGTPEGLEWPLDPVLARLTHLHLARPTLANASSYREANMLQEQGAVELFAEKCLRTFQTVKPALKPVIERGLIYFDNQAGRYAWSARDQTEFAQAGQVRGWRVHVAQRYRDPALLSSISRGAEQDLAALLKSEVAVFSGDAPQLDTGSAALFGVAKALNKPLLFEVTSSILYRGEGKQQMRLNLMLEHAATAVSSSREQTLIHLENLLQATT